MSDGGAAGPPAGPPEPPGVPPEPGESPEAPQPEKPPARSEEPAPKAPPSPAGPPAGASSGEPQESGQPAESGGPPPPPGGEAEPSRDDTGLEESFLTVWLQPRATIRRIVLRDPTYWVVPLAAIGGITQVLSLTRSPYTGITLGQVLLAAVAGGPVFGVFMLYVGAWATRRAGRGCLHGQAGPEEMRAALAWANLPQVVALPLWLLATAAFGLALYTEGGELTTGSPVYVLFVTVATALRLWSVFIASGGVAEVQGYRSAWKGLWNLILGGLLLLALVIAALVAIGILIAVASGVLG